MCHEPCVHRFLTCCARVALSIPTIFIPLRSFSCTGSLDQSIRSLASVGVRSDCSSQRHELTLANTPLSVMKISSPWYDVFNEPNLEGKSVKERFGGSKSIRMDTDWSRFWNCCQLGWVLTFVITNTREPSRCGPSNLTAHFILDIRRVKSLDLSFLRINQVALLLVSDASDIVNCDSMESEISFMRRRGERVDFFWNLFS